MLVTTSYHPAEDELQLARRLAKQLDSTFLPRNKTSIQKLYKLYGEQELLIATTLGLRYYPKGSSEPFFFHPSSAQVRLKRMLRGETDPLIESSGVQPGDTVLDCTAGLGSESILFAYASGQEGRVTALESEPMVALIVQEGLQSYTSGVDELDEAMRRIQLVQANHLDYLASLPDRSVDVVYFDPMFRETIEATDAIAPLKAIANYSALQVEAVKEARRVARKRIVLKENRDSREFERLGFRPSLRPHTKVAYGVMDP